MKVAKKFRQGDVVTIRAIVAGTDYGTDGIKVYAESSSSYSSFYAPREDLTLVIPKFEVGDRVRFPSPISKASDGRVRGTILATDKDVVWIGDFVPNDVISDEIKRVTIPAAEVELVVSKEDAARIFAAPKADEDQIDGPVEMPRTEPDPRMAPDSKG